MLELLVPAGSPEAVTAAVQNGADAVYVSFEDLTDCREPVNFSDEAFEASVRYCRIRGCKVYLALNSMIRDDEMQKAASYALRAQQAGVDAIIVRDLGLFRMLHALLPEMPLFADIHLGFYTPQSAEIARDLGFKRIFLPAETPLEDIQRLSACDIETAVYVHTNMCSTVAGHCRMSAFAGRESEDRGLCSHLCKETYTFGGRWDTNPMLWKERSLLGNIQDLEKAGVKCACIGGRENRPEYSAVMAKVFSATIHENQLPSVAEREKILRAFSENGVAEDAIYEPVSSWEKMSQKELDKFCSEIRKAYSENEQRRVPVRFALVARTAEENIHLGVQDEEGHSAMLEGPLPTPDGDVELKEDTLSESMYRTSGTPFRCTDVQIVVGEDLRVSGIELDAARRKLLYELSTERAKVPERPMGLMPEMPYSANPGMLPGAIFSFQSKNQLTVEMAELQPMAVYIPLEVLAESVNAADIFAAVGASIVASMPVGTSGVEEEEKIRTMLNKIHEHGIHQVITGNLGHALIAIQEGMEVRGDVGLAAWNSQTIQCLGTAGFQSVTLSPELTLNQIRTMGKPINTEMIAYGRVPVMTTNTCLLKASAGRCNCTVAGQMADNSGGVWPVTRAFDCRNTIWSARKIWLADKIDDWLNCGLWAVRLNFSTESPRECLDVAKSYMQNTGYRPNGVYRGLYYRGVQ